MSRKEPKLRPSFSVSEMMLLSKVLDQDIKSRVLAGDVSGETLLVAGLKQYVDTFKPSMVDNSALLAMYMQTAQLPVNPELLGQSPTAEDIKQLQQTKAHESCLDNPELSDEQKYDMLTLRGVETFSERETEFYNLKGFAIKLARLQKSNTIIKEGEL